MFLDAASIFVDVTNVAYWYKEKVLWTEMELENLDLPIHKPEPYL